jgi:hypothetical protein
MGTFKLPKTNRFPAKFPVLTDFIFLAYPARM